MNINLICEISRRGGGQAYLRDLILSLQERNNITLVTDPRFDPMNILPLVNRVATVNYTYVEGRSYLSEIAHVLKLRHDLNRVRLEKGITINNHPNIFLRKGDLNILHGFSFLDFIIDEDGRIKKNSFSNS